MLTVLGVGALVALGACLRNREVDPGTFRRQLLASGLYVLPCGGGILVDPPRAAAQLRWLHARERMIEAAWQIFLTEPRDDEVSQAAFDLARGLLYTVGDGALIERLLLQLPQPAAYGGLGQERGSAPVRLDLPTGEMRTLVAALCKRLHRPCPPGISPLTAEQETALFCWP